MTKERRKRTQAVQAQMRRGLDFIQKYGASTESVPKPMTEEERKSALARLNEHFKNLKLTRKDFENERPQD